MILSDQKNNMISLKCPNKYIVLPSYLLETL